MLSLFAITLFSTLRDILIVRIGVFTQVLFFTILSDTLYSDERFFVSFERGIIKSECTVDGRGRSYCKSSQCQDAVP